MDTSEQAALKSKEKFAARKQHVLWWIVTYFFAVSLLPELKSDYEILLSMPVLILAIRWCYLDAEERNFAVSRLLTFLLVLVFVLGFPVYLFQSRGFNGGLKALFTTAIFALICILASMGGTFLGDWIRELKS